MFLCAISFNNIWGWVHHRCLALFAPHTLAVKCQPGYFWSTLNLFVPCSMPSLRPSSTLTLTPTLASESPCLQPLYSLNRAPFTPLPEQQTRGCPRLRTLAQLIFTWHNHQIATACVLQPHSHPDNVTVYGQAHRSHATQLQGHGSQKLHYELGPLEPCHRNPALRYLWDSMSLDHKYFVFFSLHTFGCCCCC